MNQRAEIIRNINKAASLQEQAEHVAALDAFDRESAQRTASARSIDLTDTIVRQTLSPVAVHERSTIQTDWLGDVTASANGDYANQISAEAALWFGRTSPEVRSDREEFIEQARGKARRTASVFGESAQAAERHFMDYVSFLHRQAASGLPQVQQLVDSFENPAQTPLPQDAFDNFAPPVDPINEGVVGTETSERAPLLQEIESEGNGGTTETHHDSTQQFAGPPPVQAQAMFNPSVAISHVGSLDDFRQAALSDPKQYGCEDCKSTKAGAQCPSCQSWKTAAISDPNQHHCEDCARTKVGDQCPSCQSWKTARRREAASTLPQVEQVVDSFENPARTPLPQDVAFPWELDEDETPDERSDHKAAYQRRAAYVARLAVQDPRSLTPIERKEILAFTASLVQRTADQWSQSGPQAHGPGPANSPYTTPEGTGGSFDQGHAAGEADWNLDQAPTYADDSASVPPFVRGHSEGYQDAAQADPLLGGAQPGMLPPGAGGMADGYLTHAASRKVASIWRKNCSECGGTGHDSSPWKANCSECGGSGDAKKTAKTASVTKVSAAFTTQVEEANPEFAKGYRYAAKWKPGVPLVTKGSAAFEAGLYAGISDSPARQKDWTRLHREASAKYSNRDFLTRLSMHREFSKKVARSLNTLQVRGSYLVQAATSSDLDTMAPGASPSPTGQTPINGPGTPPPLQGQSDPAAPGGPSPYNGAEPFGSPVVPSGGPTTGTPTAIDTTPGGPVDQASYEHLSPQTHAFRKRVQASLLKARQGQ